MSTDTGRPEDAVACPACGKGPGDSCDGPMSHPTRIRAFEATATSWVISDIKVTNRCGFCGDEFGVRVKHVCARAAIDPVAGRMLTTVDPSGPDIQIGNIGPKLDPVSPDRMVRYEIDTPVRGVPIQRNLVTDKPPAKIFGPGEEDKLREELKKLDTRVLFDGRTVLVTAVFFTTFVDPKALSERVRRAAAGPLLRMTVGALSGKIGELTTKSFVNTDEDEKIVGARVAAVTPKPAYVEVGIVDPREALPLWAEYHRTIDGGD